MVGTIKLVFSNFKYALLASGIFALMMISLLILSEYVFLEPYVVAHLPSGGELGLVLIVILSALSALVIPMNLFWVNLLKRSKQKMSGGIFGAIIGAFAGVCSCGPIGFAVISTFGSVGAATTAFLTNYEIPLRMAAIAILVVTYFTVVKSLKVECNLNSQP